MSEVSQNIAICISTSTANWFRVLQQSLLLMVSEDTSALAVQRTSINDRLAVVVPNDK